MTQAELRNLLQDALELWDLSGRLEVTAAGISVSTASLTVVVQPALPVDHPVRWLLNLPNGRIRRLPSTTALLTTLRNVLQAEVTQPG